MRHASIDRSLSSPVVEDLVVDAFDWENAAIGRRHVFRRCVFTEMVNAEGAAILQDLRFEDCTFEEFAMFRGALLPNRTRFERCTFCKGASFAAGESGAGESPVEHMTLRHLAFLDCRFAGYLTFNNRAFHRSARFTRCSFEEPPHFQNAQMHQGTDFSGSDFHPADGSDENRASAERAFRALRRFMQEVGDSDRRNEMIGLELETRLGRTDLPASEALAIRVYRAGSDYGRSLVRPPLALAVVSAFLLAALVLTAAVVADKLAVVPSLWFLVEQTFSPFSALASGYAPESALQGAFESATGVYRAVGVLQSVASFTALALWVFALRRRFVE